jgi:hypothetical protein
LPQKSEDNGTKFFGVADPSSAQQPGGKSAAREDVRILAKENFFPLALARGRPSPRNYFERRLNG